MLTIEVFIKSELKLTSPLITAPHPTQRLLETALTHQSIDLEETWSHPTSELTCSRCGRSLCEQHLHKLIDSQLKVWLVFLLSLLPPFSRAGSINHQTWFGMSLQIVLTPRMWLDHTAIEWVSWPLPVLRSLGHSLTASWVCPIVVREQSPAAESYRKSDWILPAFL